MIMVRKELKQLERVNSCWIIFLGPLRFETQIERAALIVIHLVLCGEIIH